MEFHPAQLIFAVILCLSVNWTVGIEKDIIVDCLDAQAATITEGGVVANCGSLGLTRTKSIFPWLFQLAHVLQGVNISQNHIKHVTVFPVLPRVLTLTLHHNSIREIEPLAFTGLENLQSLDLSFNRITGESLKGVLVGKKSPGLDRYEPLPIRMLFLSHNEVSSLQPNVFEHLQYLRDLHLDFNPITAINDSFTAALRKLPELKLLNLANVELSSLPKDAFSGLELTSLLLNGNHFTQVPDLGGLGHSLRLLNINQNPIQELDETSFSGLRSINEILASGMPQLTSIKSGTFSNLENIRVISCSYNTELVSIDENAFWNYKTTKRSNLQEVYLNNNGLPRIRKYLLPWVKMTRVTLDGNKWVCDCRLHWLVRLLHSRNTTVDRIAELKCWEPTWLNGTQMVFWDIDTKSRYENYPCVADQEPSSTTSPQLETKQPDEDRVKFYHFIIVGGLILLVVLLVSIIAFNKYKNYRPIYNVEKMSSTMHNEMKLLKGSTAEKTQLVP